MTQPFGEQPVVVVGARCAGAATAMLLARQGHEVLLVDRADFPSDALSTHAIARGGVVQLSRWGLLDSVLDSGAPPIRAMSFHFQDGSDLRLPVKARAGVDMLIAPRRHVLDMIVLSAALEAGVRFESGLSVSDVTTDISGRVVGVTARDRDGRVREIPAAFVVGADGVRSRIARAVGARTIEQRPSHAATYYAYVAGLETDGFEFHLGPRSFAGVFPTHDDEANVWVCCDAQGAAVADMAVRTRTFIHLLERSAPALRSRFRVAQITSPVRGAARLPNQILEAAGRGWALVGDAGYHRDPITGHGITDAFRDAELLAVQLDRVLRREVSEATGLRTYARTRDEAIAPIFDITCRLAMFPPPDEFSALQMELSARLDDEARRLAALPAVPMSKTVAA